MTTTAHEDQFTIGTQTIEPVRQPYNTVSILKRNVADLELELKRQTERATHKGATHCDDCGLTWLDDGLNPLGCPYCKSTAPAPAVPTDEQIHAAYRNALGQSIRERDMPEIRKFARALLQSAPQASAVQLVDGSDDYYDYLGALVEQHPAGVMRRNTDDKAPAVPDDTAILDWLEMQRVDVASVVGHRPQYGFLSVGASGKSDLRSKVRALLQSAEAQASDKLQLTPAPTHPADRNAGEVRHD